MKRLKLIETRNANGWTQQQIGNMVGLTKQAICDIERGRRNPSYLVAQQLVDLLGIEHRELFAKHD